MTNTQIILLAKLPRLACTWSFPARDKIFPPSQVGGPPGSPFVLVWVALVSNFITSAAVRRGLESLNGAPSVNFANIIRLLKAEILAIVDTMETKWEMISFTLIMLLACLVQEHKCASIDKTQAAMEAYESLFVRKDKLPSEQVIPKIDILESHIRAGRQPRFHLSLELRALADVRAPRRAYCVDEKHVDRLRRLLRLAESQYIALQPYMADAFRRQLEECEKNLAKAFDQFRDTFPNYWLLIRGLNSLARLIPMDRAVAMLVMMQLPGCKRPRDRDIRALALRIVASMRGACVNFLSSLGLALRLALRISNEFMREDRDKLLTWFEYRQVCEEFERFYFETQIRRMIIDRYFERDLFSNRSSCLVKRILG